jgi:hypothetical protein
LNTAEPAAATRAPARASHAPAEESVAEESLHAHAQRLVQCRLRAMACGVLDPCITLLQRLRKLTGGAQNSDAETGEDRPRPRNAELGGRRDAVAPPDELDAGAPKPRRRLRAFLTYFSVLLAGSMVGGALAYDLLAKLLDRQATDSRRVEAALSKQSKSIASSQKKFDEAEAKRTEAVNKFEEANKKQMEAEKKLEAALADSKAAAEKQKKLDEAVKLLEQIRGAERSGTAQRSPPVSSAERTGRPAKTGDCSLGTGNVGALNDCLQEFNR